MTPLLRSVVLTCCFLILILAGCASDGIPKWRHFHGNLAGQGYIPVESGFALSSAWIAGPYKLTSSSPVIGNDIDGKQIVYIGTVDGELVAIDSEDGNERWRRSFASKDKIAHIVSTPAVSRNGDIYVITHHPIANRHFSSVLHKVDEFSRIRWSYAFADNGFTSGSPKILKWGEDTLIFVYVTAVLNNDPQGALLVLRDNGKTVDKLDDKVLGRCKWGSAEQRANSQDVFDSFSVVEELISVNPAETGGRDLPDVFVDPTLAVFTDRKVPLIAIADNLCSIGAYEWDDELSVVWREFHPFEKHSSTALLPNGMMVFGRQDGMALAYDMETGVKLWEYDAGQPVFATPAASLEELFIIAKDHIEVLRQQDGTLVHNGELPRKYALMAQTYASPAVTENCIYVSTQALLTFSHDLSSRSQDTNFSGNGLASIALANNGAIYAVAADGTIHKYLGPK
ncbi:MAG: PQQ-binding-like beta-propeller repeat protein [Deltaproteobacteria bacterium]|jgi:outer membrane protein assembly factor BamB|nr:PQQ-binding-like beta-propeller repeat protein [Deltaproteobacteria bacterium]